MTIALLLIESDARQAQALIDAVMHEGLPWHIVLVQSLEQGRRALERAKFELVLVLDVIGKGAAQSWQMDNRGKTMLAGQFDFGFAVDWMRKDLALVLDEAARVQADVPVAALVDSFYAEVQAHGGARWDTSSLVVRLTEK